MGGLDCVVRVHREMKRAARPCRTCKQNDDADLKTPRHFGNAVVPHRVAGDVDQLTVPLRKSEHEADHIAGKRLDAGGPVPRALR
jgi:hypothetical protein